MILARTGDALVFGEESDVRRKLDDQGALEHFAGIWQQVVEPEVRKAPVISAPRRKKSLRASSAILQFRAPVSTVLYLLGRLHCASKRGSLI